MRTARREADGAGGSRRFGSCAAHARPPLTNAHRTLSVLALVVAPCLARPGPVQTPDTGLWVDGKRLQAVAIPLGASSYVRYAADELRQYVHRRCREELSLTETDAPLSVPAAYLGPWQWCPAFPGEPAKPSDEGVFVCAEGGDLHLTGGGPRGVIYAVSSFLQQRLGIRWYQPSPWGEEVPPPGRVDLPPFRYTHEPSFWFRDISVCIHESISEWAIRNRLNTRLGAFAEERGGCHAHAIGGHASSKYIEPALFEPHPDYFAMKDGKRWLPPADAYGKRRYQPCTTHPDVLSRYIDTIRSSLDRSSKQRLASVSPDDVTGRWCSCPACLALDTGETMMLHGRRQRVVSDRFFLFVNSIADAVAESHPDAHITTFAYHQYRPVPQRISVRPNVVVMLCQPGAYNHPIDSGASEQIREFEQNLREWTGKCEDLILYRYMFKTMWESLPYPRHRILAQDLKYAHKLGLAGEHGQAQGKNWGMLGLNWYLHAQLLWDVDQDIDALLDDYYTGYFREAGEPMEAYFELMADAFRNADGPIGEYRQIAPSIYADRFLTPQLLQRARSHLDAAQQLASSSRVKRRVRMVEIPFRYAEHYMQGLRAAQRFETSDEEHDLRTAVDEYEIAVEAAREGEACWAMVYNFREGAKRWLSEREIPKLRRKLAARFAWKHRLVADLPTTWRFAFETNQKQAEEQWPRPEFDDGGWQDARVDRTWQEQGLAPRDFRGAGWYRTTVTVPDTPAPPAGRRLSLRFGGVDAAAKLWINGSLAGEHKYVPDVSWRTPFEVDVTERLNPGPNPIAVRVYTGGGNGGLYRPVRLLTPSNVTLIAPASRTAWGRPPAVRTGPDWELVGKEQQTATIRTPNRGGKNPYDGSWIEFRFELREEGDYQAWLRLVQYQETEAKSVSVDDAVVGVVHSEPRAGTKGHTQFRRVGKPVTLKAGQHRLKIECTGIQGWIDPINTVALTADTDLDLEALQSDRSPNSTPVVVRPE